MKHETEDYYIVASDPFGRRVQSLLPACGDVVLVDAASNMDRTDKKLFNLVMGECPNLGQVTNTGRNIL